jgi:dipeptidyl aminopeptidase/acylaminoacyl peptidase
VLPQFGDKKLFAYLQSQFNEGPARLSPDGRWLAYVSDESRRKEIFVASFPQPGGKWQISTGGGEIPIWSRDGHELFFVSADNKMMAVEFKTTGGKLEPGVPKPLFDVRLGRGDTNFDVSKDGRFLIPTLLDQGASEPLTVVLNWPEMLKKK